MNPQVHFALWTYLVDDDAEVVIRCNIPMLAVDKYSKFQNPLIEVYTHILIAGS